MSQKAMRKCLLMDSFHRMGKYAPANDGRRLLTNAKAVLTNRYALNDIFMKSSHIYVVYSMKWNTGWRHFLTYCSYA
jgi:hypothetical protein